jgi:hypothetical protein
MRPAVLSARGYMASFREISLSGKLRQVSTFKESVLNKWHFFEDRRAFVNLVNDDLGNVCDDEVSGIIWWGGLRLYISHAIYPGAYKPLSIPDSLLLASSCW